MLGNVVVESSNVVQFNLIMGNVTSGRYNS